MLRWALSGQGLLREAWLRYAAADALAEARKPPANRLALTAVVLATCTAITAVAAGVIKDEVGHTALRVLVTALPFLAAAVLGLLARHNRLGSWVAARSAAESMIREIYLFRAQAGDYLRSESPPALFAEVLAQMDSGADILHERPTKELPVHWPPKRLMTRVAPADRLLSPLTPQVYDDARALDQLRYFERNAHSLNRQSGRLAKTIYLFTGSAGLALALSWKWEPVGLGLAGGFAALAAAFVAWREFRQLDQQLTAWMLTAAAVRAARARWLAHGTDGTDERVLANYVGEVEAALAAEGSEWSRRLLQAHLTFAEGRT